ncbi:peptidase inhibitor family I36 protein [Streptomyces sp. WAC 01325]|uniref:peptidase inhibitor family I36 protein n=1 Tax=Streptomyces sp. WAC 01325 TaxID=2203202 RepID=UPI00163C47C3
MKLGRRVSTLALPVSGAIAAVFAVAPQANAAAACYQGEFCLYQHANYTGSVYKLRAGQNVSNFGYEHFTNGDPLNDNASSVRNLTNRVAFLYADENFQGAHIVIGSQTSIPDLGHYKVPFGDVISFNDKASSIDW